MKSWKKIAMTAATLALSATLVFSVTACSDETTTARMSSITDIDEDLYDALCSEVYDDALGEFYEIYSEARAITGTSNEEVSERYALMAIAEAKLMESAVMVPTTTSGGAYAMSRVAPHTYSYVLWGNDGERFHQMLVAEEFLTVDDRAEVNDMYSEALETGEAYDYWESANAYSDSVRAYLEGQGYTIKDSYTIGYSSDPQTYDVLATSRSADSEVLVNTYDSLVEYDELGNLQYALADQIEVSDDGLTYYFHIRDNASWYTVGDSTNAYAPVTADDFVAGFHHMLDAGGGLEYLVEGLVVGVDDYLATGSTYDFSTVGVKSGTYDVDTDTFTADATEGGDGEWVAYTLTSECSYFMTMLGYGVFAPMNRTYFESLGGAFGSEYDSSAENYTYGTSRNTILYCGPYIITNATSQSTIEFTANTNYWNYDNINLHTITWLYNDGSDVTKSYNDAVDGTIDGCSFNTSTLVLAQSDTTTDVHNVTGTYYDLFYYVSATDATSYLAAYNINRLAYDNVAYDGGAASSKTELDALRTNIAMQNVHFRRAISFAFNRASYNAQSVGDDLALTSLRNSYTPGTFVQLSHETTVDINGTEVTYPVGTYYGEIMQDQIDADGVAIQVWDEDNQSSDGFDGWYSVENAVAEMEQAVAELRLKGVEITTSNPIQIDYVCYSASNTRYNMGVSYKNSLESALGGLVQVNLVEVSTTADWYYSSYYCDYGYQSNYDMSDLSGWGPDYGDPSTYLDTMLPDGAGYMVKLFGLW